MSRILERHEAEAARLLGVSIQDDGALFECAKSRESVLETLRSRRIIQLWVHSVTDKTKRGQHTDARSTRQRRRHLLITWLGGGGVQFLRSGANRVLSSM